ncbi:hypothetical protein BV898_19160 [Hypsibius exemplaris]|uniref:Uncharacterized protein n=1 Tax=Hypsibius exemplaris TaxID=2072580 RepID=A0A9X6NKZ1_HYPEX|nr:hypothetical protein BV898_19160 [Hypsibius exemplaris]
MHALWSASSTGGRREQNVKNSRELMENSCVNSCGAALCRRNYTKPGMSPSDQSIDPEIRPKSSRNAAATESDRRKIVGHYTKTSEDSQRPKRTLMKKRMSQYDRRSRNCQENNPTERCRVGGVRGRSYAGGAVRTRDLADRSRFVALCPVNTSSEPESQMK